MRRISLAAVAFAASMAPCLQAYADDWDGVVAAAKTEGRVVFYSAEMGTACQEDRIKDFEARYGIKVDESTARVTALEQRITVEQATNRAVGDVFGTGKGGIVRAEAQGRLQPHSTIPNAARLNDRSKGDQFELEYEGILEAILASTDKIAAADMPKTWQDLLAPRWKGQILADDLSVVGLGLLVFKDLYNAFGQGYVTKLGQQQMVFSREQGNDAQRIARGEYPLYLPFQITYIPGLKGLPLTTIFPTDGVPYANQAVAVLKDAPHPNAARLFINHLLDPKWQSICAQGGATLPAITVLTPGSAPIEQQVASAKLLGDGSVDPKEQEPLTKIANEAFQSSKH